MDDSRCLGPTFPLILQKGRIGPKFHSYDQFSFLLETF